MTDNPLMFDNCTISVGAPPGAATATSPAPQAAAATQVRARRVAGRINRGIVRTGAQLQARYDLAQTTDGNRKHWSAADALSAELANSHGVRFVMRNRTRYEVANNSYVKGMVKTACNDTVGGEGPRLQMLSPRSTPETGGIRTTNTKVETDWAAWAAEVKLAKKLRKMRRAKMESGEVVVTVFTNPKMKHPVKLDLMLVECDRLHDPTAEYVGDPLWCDGIRYDQYENPVSYRILRYHPGGITPWLPVDKWFDDYPAAYVFHYFEDERPGQRRGVPELSPSIQTGGELRRFDNAALRTAEVHARLTMTMESNTVTELEQGAEDPEQPVNMDTVELPESAALVLPPGMKLNAFNPTQPTADHTAFVDTKLRETGRCINMPFTIAALDSTKSNLSARYLDAQIYAAAIKVERDDLANEFLDWLFLNHWVPEYWLAVANVPRDVSRYPHKWRWPSLNQHADPQKVAGAQETRLNTATGSLPDEIAEDGDDWEDLFDNEAQALGVTREQYQGLIRLKRFGTPNKDGTPVKPPMPAGADGGGTNGSPGFDRLRKQSSNGNGRNGTSNGDGADANATD